jgi:pimeloyl-ACP methyl ester carboxylesterase
MNDRRIHARSIDRDALLGEERLEQGYVIILPGIEGHSRWNRAIRRGLVNAGVPYAIEIHDWTRGPLWYFWNLRDGRRHRDQAQCIAERIADYRGRYPGRPVYLIGHSGGGAMTAFALQQLPDGIRATGGIMLVSALSPWFPLQSALQHTERGLWNYSAHGDLFFVGIGTTLFGTCDGRHSPAAGLVGFHHSALQGCDPTGSPPLRQMWFHWRMLRDFNLAGHLSCVNPRFVSNWIAPILMGDEPESPAIAKFSSSPCSHTSTPAVAAKERCHTAESLPAGQRPVR